MAKIKVLNDPNTSAEAIEGADAAEWEQSDAQYNYKVSNKRSEGRGNPHSNLCDLGKIQILRLRVFIQIQAHSI